MKKTIHYRFNVSKDVYKDYMYILADEITKGNVILRDGPSIISWAIRAATLVVYMKFSWADYFKVCSSKAKKVLRILCVQRSKRG